MMPHQIVPDLFLQSQQLLVSHIVRIDIVGLVVLQPFTNLTVGSGLQVLQQSVKIVMGKYHLALR
jgi:hypothetical protein